MSLGMGLGLWMGHNPALAVGGGGATFTKVRYRFTANGEATAYIRLSEANIYATNGGADISGTSTVSSSSNLGGFPATNMNDNDTSTLWIADDAAGYPQDLIFTFGSAIAKPYSVDVTCAVSFTQQAPTAFTIDGWDGSNWVNWSSPTGLSWTALETKTYVL